LHDFLPAGKGIPQGQMSFLSSFYLQLKQIKDLQQRVREDEIGLL